MNKVRVELIKGAARALLRSPEAKDMCENLARSAASGLGAGYLVTSYTGRNRVNASIFTETKEAAQDNASNNSILKGIGRIGGRG